MDAPPTQPAISTIVCIYIFYILYSVQVANLPAGESLAMLMERMARRAAAGAGDSRPLVSLLADPWAHKRAWLSEPGQGHKKRRRLDWRKGPTIGVAAQDAGPRDSRPEVDPREGEPRGEGDSSSCACTSREHPISLVSAPPITAQRGGGSLGRVAPPRELVLYLAGPQKCIISSYNKDKLTTYYNHVNNQRKQKRGTICRLPTRDRDLLALFTEKHLSKLREGLKSAAVPILPHRDRRNSALSGGGPGT
jgi:hypothetical protein